VPERISGVERWVRPPSILWLTVLLVALQALVFLLPAVASASTTTNLRPDSDISNSPPWTLVGASTVYGNLNDAINAAQTPNTKTNYIKAPGTQTRSATVTLGTTPLGAKQIMSATAYAYTKGPTQLKAMVGTSVRGSQSFNGTGWHSLSFWVAGQSEVDDLRLLITSSGNNASVYAAFVKLTAGTPTFSDEFDGPAGGAPDSAKWTAINQCDNWGSVSCNTDRAENVQLDGTGNLLVRAIREDWTDPYGSTGTWTTARLETQNKFSFTYGTMKARIKVPAGQGLWPSFWTNGQTGWPATGEIDAMELLGNQPSVYYCAVHGADSQGQHVGKQSSYTSPGSLADDSHVYEAQWTPTQVAFYVDGTPCGAASTTGMQTFAAQQLLVGMAVGGSWPGSPDDSTPSPADMLVDWVQVIQ
jgi:beta-glucanase (GH16 family)